MKLCISSKSQCKSSNEISYLINNSSIELCMNYSTTQLWSDLIKTKKEEFAIWTNMPKNPNLN